MQITLAIQCDDGSIHPRWQRTIEVTDEATALSWALTNWRPAQGIEMPGGGHYLNESLMLSVNGDAFESIRDVLARLNAPERRAAA